MPGTTFVPALAHDESGLYTLQESTNTDYIRFYMPGQESADALRRTVRYNALRDLLVDKSEAAIYLESLTDVSRFHLPALQASFWRNAPACKMPMSQPSLSDGESLQVEPIVSQVKIIAGLLNKNYIFVCANGNRNECAAGMCDLPADHGSVKRFVRLEPLIDWATVTPAHDLHMCQGHILAFRRNGAKMDDPLWYKAVQQLKAQDLSVPTYCLGCVEILADRKAEAWLAIDHLDKAATPQNDSGYSQQTDAGSNLERYCTDDFVTETTLEPSLPQLDGTMDTPPQPRLTLSCPPKRAKEQTNFDIWGDSKKITDRNAPDRNLINVETSAQQPTAACVAKTNIPFANAATAPFSSSELPHTPESGLSTKPLSSFRDHIINSLGVNLVQNKYPSIVPSQLPQSGGAANTELTKISSRKFGSEVDANKLAPTVQEINQNTKSTGSSTTSMSAPKHFSILSPLTPSSVSDVENEAPLAHLKAKPRVTKAEGKIVKPSQVILTPQKPLKPKALPKAPRFKTITESFLQSKFQAARRRIKPKQTFAPVFAKRPPLAAADILSDYTIQEYEAFLTRVPDYKQRICSCQQAARSPDLKIVQCINVSCMIRWYHFNCLEKSQKIQTRFGTQLCPQCRNEKEIATWNKEGTWPVEEHVKSEDGLLVCDLAAAFPGTGGLQGIPNPYGLGAPLPQVLLDQETEHSMSKIPLGNSSFWGYEESRPQVLVDFHADPQAFAGRYSARYAHVDHYTDDHDYEYEGEEEFEEYEENEELAEMDVVTDATESVIELQEHD